MIFMDETRRLILAACDLGARDGRFVKCRAIILRAQELKDGKVRSYQPVIVADEDRDPDHDALYELLLHLIVDSDPEVSYFEGRGNLGTDGDPPADAPFTECCLTTLGGEIAEGLKRSP